jgi:hypothetical protein
MFWYEVVTIGVLAIALWKLREAVRYKTLEEFITDAEKASHSTPYSKTDTNETTDLASYFSPRP